ncbi:RloB family protein [Levilactobacillus humaensis]|uniref:RloB family protein n=1 Tax=Levilactobacillus humaensis TaxID=2950375 RepID=UPI0021C2E936|nr:RloB family protein [Levilactobacillus humaensis]
MSRHIGKKARQKKRVLLPGSYLIVSEGTVTEVAYFNEWAKLVNKAYQGISASPVVKVMGCGESNQKLVDYVKQEQALDEKIYENVWLVFDKDDFPDADFNTAIRTAKKLKWHAAWSNNCFELWYVLHFDYLTTAVDRKTYYDKLSRELGRHGSVTGYQKSNQNILAILTPERRQKAINRAKKLMASYAEHRSTPNSQRNPATTVYVLVEELEKLVEEGRRLQQQ